MMKNKRISNDLKKDNKQSKRIVKETKKRKKGKEEKERRQAMITRPQGQSNVENGDLIYPIILEGYQESQQMRRLITIRKDLGDCSEMVNFGVL